MNKKENTEIGEVISVSGNIISIQMANNVKSNMPIIDGTVYRIGQIGSFVRIPLGYVNLYGIVTQVGAAAMPENIRTEIKEDYSLSINSQWMSVVLIGEHIGGEFSRGISQSPTTGDKVNMVTNLDLEIIYGGDSTKNSIEVGFINASENLPAKLNIDKLVSRHSAILGSTGSGKSNTVGTLLKAIANKKLPSTRVLVIDPHGEYNSILKDISTVHQVNASQGNEQKELYIPFWALPFQELMSLFSGSITDANRDYIRHHVENAKKKSVVINNIKMDIEMVTADTPVPFSLKRCWFELDDFERQTFYTRGDNNSKTLLTEEGNEQHLKSNIYTPASIGGGSPFLNNNAKGILTFLESMRLRMKDSRLNFLFEPGKYTPDEDGSVECDLNEMIHEWLGSNTPITILDLSGIPSEVMTLITGSLLKIVYDSLFWGQEISIGGRQQPLLIVLEEAHNYLKSGDKSISSRVIQTIAKEGRKYGVGIALVSQRPSEIDETVLSQCGTIIALRMNNSKDRGFVSSAMQDELQSMLSLLPSLRTGEAIVSGEAVKIPSRIQFSKLSTASKSSDPKVSEQWKLETDNSLEQYEKLITLWRNKRTKGDE